MNRRIVLKSFIAAVGSAATAGAVPFFQRKAGGVLDFGWQADPDAIKKFVASQRRPFLSQVNGAIKDSGKGKKAFLHLAYEEASGKDYVPHDQGAPDCVSHGFGLAVDFLASVQIITKKLPQLWKGKAATEPIYGGSRNEIGGGVFGGGSTGHWAVKWLQKYGVLIRKKYGEYDLTKYSAAKAYKYGREGCPDALEPIAKEHPVKSSAICKTYEQLRDCIYNGSPVPVCSRIGFGASKGNKRDRQGFLKPQRRGGWNHCMLFAAFDDEYRRPGALCFNSWGPEWVGGPTRGPQPAGTFWIDADVVTQMLQFSDSHALSAYQGFPRRRDIPDYILH